MLQLNESTVKKETVFNKTIFLYLTEVNNCGVFFCEHQIYLQGPNDQITSYYMLFQPPVQGHFPRSSWQTYYSNDETK